MNSSTFWGLVGFGALAWYIYHRATGGSTGKALFCTSCGHEGPAKSVTRGSILIEIVLWLCFIVPGLIYSLWRLNSKGKVCASCGHSTLIPTGSPAALAQKRAMGMQTD